jgi:SAM-dependent methyltransferase
MGLTIHAAKMLQQSKLSGANFTKVCQVGRQSLVIHPKDRLKIGIPDPNIAIKNGDYQWPWADSFFRDCLHVQDFHTMDYSDYEGADLLHDLNSPLSPEHYGKFDAVVDGGTLEHIFNVPEALKTYMRLVNVGGRIFIFTPANGNCGHGFFQFSPEFFYRVFQPSNGFEVAQLWLVTHPFPSNFLSRKETCYEVLDPAKVGDRVIISGSGPMMIMVEARKVSDVVPFASGPPLQSDYVTEWNSAQASTAGSRRLASTVKNLILNQLPLSLRYYLRGLKQKRSQSLKGSHYIRKID